MCLQAHVYGHAWRPEDEQPHNDERHGGTLPRRPQNPGGVPDPFKAHLTNVIHHSLQSLFIQLHTESSRVTVHPQLTLL